MCGLDRRGTSSLLNGLGSSWRGRKSVLGTFSRRPGGWTASRGNRDWRLGFAARGSDRALGGLRESVSGGWRMRGNG
eukprot:7178610-Alexandrium_andersonii.AAC.1